MEIVARLQSLFNLSFRVPNKRIFPPDSLHRVLIEGEAPTAELISIICQSFR
jgi:hypothetical protein